jgi:hypothetical protein
MSGIIGIRIAWKVRILSQSRNEPLRRCGTLKSVREKFQTREIIMNSDVGFQLVCRDCGALGIKIESPGDASPETVVRCSNCGNSRGSIGALRELATRLQALSRSAKLKSGSELVSLHRELQSLRRRVQTEESTTRLEG